MVAKGDGEFIIGMNLKCKMFNKTLWPLNVVYGGDKENLYSLYNCQQQTSII